MPHVQQPPNPPETKLERDRGNLIEKLSNDLAASHARASELSFQAFTLGEKITELQFDRALNGWLAVIGLCGTVLLSIWIVIH